MCTNGERERKWKRAERGGMRGGGAPPLLILGGTRYQGSTPTTKHTSGVTARKKCKIFSSLQSLSLYICRENDNLSIQLFSHAVLRFPLILYIYIYAYYFGLVHNVFNLTLKQESYPKIITLSYESWLNLNVCAGCFVIYIKRRRHMNVVRISLVRQLIWLNRVFYYIDEHPVCRSETVTACIWIGAHHTAAKKAKNLSHKYQNK